MMSPNQRQGKINKVMKYRQEYFVTWVSEFFFVTSIDNDLSKQQGLFLFDAGQTWIKDLCVTIWPFRFFHVSLSTNEIKNGTLQVVM